MPGIDGQFEFGYGSGYEPLLPNMNQNRHLNKKNKKRNNKEKRLIKEKTSTREIKVVQSAAGNGAN